MWYFYLVIVCSSSILLEIPFCTLLMVKATCPVLAISVDPDQFAFKKPSDLDLHCLSLNM